MQLLPPIPFRQGENGSALSEIRGLQERLVASEHIAESLRRELRELGAQQGHTHTELHQARLQVAQLTLQLSEENLILREERANWALEREAYKQAAEVRDTDAAFVLPVQTIGCTIHSLILDIQNLYQYNLKVITLVDIY